MVDVTQLVKILKVVFLLSLISVCFLGFNLPSINRFLDDKVIIHESVEKYDSLRPPAITICPKKWKSEKVTMVGAHSAAHYENHCGNASTVDDYMACVTKKTYGFEEIVESATRGWFKGVMENFTDPQLWTWDLTFAMWGRCYTLDYDKLFKVNPRNDGIALQLIVKKDYVIYLFDPDFHFITANPLLTMPVTILALHGSKSDPKFRTVVIKMLRTEELNRLEAP